MNNNSISTKAMLAALHISTWSGKVTDKKVTKETEAAHNAHDSGRWEKNVIAKAALDSIHKKESRVKDYFDTHTLKWMKGWQLLPAEEYLDLSQEISRLISEVEQEKYLFFPTYQDWIDEAKVRLNGMFNEKDYPTLEDLKEKFKIKFVISPIPETSDFRVSLSDEEVEKIKEQIGKQMQDAQAEASRDLWNRVSDALKAMVERLSQPEAVFRNSLVDNVKELTTLLPRLNYTGDPRILAVCDSMKDLCVDPETLRNNNAMRGEVANRAKNVLQSYGLWS